MKIGAVSLTSILVGLFVVLVFASEALALSHLDATAVVNPSNYLSTCKSAANCVVSINTQANAATKPDAIAPIVYHRDLETAQTILLKILAVVPRTEVVKQTDHYIHAQSKNRFGSVDELEFVFARNQQLIYLRSASPNLPFDFGLNRRRLEQIRLAMQDLNA
jgi:uncharacterized protein (DUF1499 family)